MQGYCDVYKWTLLGRTSPEVKCLHSTSSRGEICTLSVNNELSQIFTRGRFLYTQWEKPKCHVRISDKLSGHADRRIFLHQISRNCIVWKSDHRLFHCTLITGQHQHVKITNITQMDSH